MLKICIEASGVEPPCGGAAPKQNPPILRDGLENAALFQCLAPHHVMVYSYSKKILYGGVLFFKIGWRQEEEAA